MSINTVDIEDNGVRWERRGNDFEQTTFAGGKSGGNRSAENALFILSQVSF